MLTEGCLRMKNEHCYSLCLNLRNFIEQSCIKMPMLIHLQCVEKMSTEPSVHQAKFRSVNYSRVDVLNAHNLPGRQLQVDGRGGGRCGIIVGEGQHCSIGVFIHREDKSTRKIRASFGDGKSTMGRTDRKSWK